MSEPEYCPECSTYIGRGPSSRTDCPACGADLADLAPFEEGDEDAPDVEDDEIAETRGLDGDAADGDESGETW